MSDFGRALRDARIEAGWTQQQAADAAGVVAGHYANCESGCGSPLAVDTVLRLARAMGCDPAAMLEAKAAREADRIARRWPMSKRARRELAALLVREAGTVKP